jgi:hypothetical protein
MPIRKRLLAFVIVCLTLAAAPSCFGQECVGDCDGNRQVRIEELFLGVRIALGISRLDMCASLDCPQAQVGALISCAIMAVRNALVGCPTARPSPTSTPTPTCEATPPPPSCGPGDEIVCGPDVCAGCHCATPTRTPSPTSTPDARVLLDRNRQLWRETGGIRYRMIERVRYFGLFDYPHLVAMEVRNGEIVLIRDVWTGAEVVNPPADVYRGVEGIFDLIEEAIDTHADRIAVQYEPHFGIPIDVWVDYDEDLYDEERGYELSDITIWSGE